jgi:membrane associated rhomboid family serine protease
VLQLILGAFSLAGYGTGIAFFAHIGGFAFGYVAGRIYCSGKPKTQPKPAMGFFPKRRQ